MKHSIWIYGMFFCLLGCQSQPLDISGNEPPGIAEMTHEQLGQILDSIYVEDQQYRGQLDSVAETFGQGSEEWQQLLGKMFAADQSNAKIVTEILDTHGWLSAEEIGLTANRTLFLVIQHANHELQEKYLPMMRQAVKDGDADASRLALLEDRIALGNGQPQIYGSQIGTDSETGQAFVFPMIEPDSVNARRASVGLGSIEDYAAYFDIDWNLEAYKAELPKRLEQLKEKSN